MPLILPGNVASATASTGYDVANSCRFNDGDSASMTKTSGSGDRRQFTISAWVKRGVLGTEQEIYGSGDSGSNVFGVFFDGSTNRLSVTDYQSGGTLTLTTNRVFRDCSAWYHVCVAIDTEQATNTNRVKIYINGTQETSFATANYPDEDEDLYVNVSGQPHNVGVDQGPGRFFDGYMAEVVFIDGTQYAASDFGEFDSDSPTIWKPKDPSGLTFGTNGFYLDFEASDNLGNDANGGTDLTESNLDATDQASDSPTNNFCTMNPLSIDPDSTFTFSEGNLEYATSSSTRGYWVSTIAVSTGKWYFEYKCTNNQSRTCVGIAGAPAAGNNDPESGIHDNATIYTTINGKISYNSNGGTDNYYNTATGGDDIIIGCALDLTSATNTIAFSIDGAWVTGDGTTDTDFTNVLLNDDFTNVASTVNGVYHFIAGDDGGDQDINGQVNFGNPPFSISSGNADADGYGNFEYAVPSGYYALCTKNLAEYG